MRRFGLTILLLLLLTSCAARPVAPQSPEWTIYRFFDHLATGDPEGAHDLLSPALSGQLPVTGLAAYRVRRAEVVALVRRGALSTGPQDEGRLAYDVTVEVQPLGPGPWQLGRNLVQMQLIKQGGHPWAIDQLGLQGVGTLQAPTPGAPATAGGMPAPAGSATAGGDGAPGPTPGPHAAAPGQPGLQVQDGRTPQHRPQHGVVTPAPRTSPGAPPPPAGAAGSLPRPGAERFVVAQVEQGPSGPGPSAFVDVDHGWLAVGSALYATDDGGRSWQKQADLPLPAYGLAFVSPVQGWASLQTQVLSTADGGRTWQPVDVGRGGPFLGILFTDPMHGWLQTAAGWLTTTDGGKNWLPLAQGAPCQDGPGGQPAILRPASLAVQWAVCGSAAAEPQLWRSADSGGNWQAVGRAGDVLDLSFIDDLHGFSARGGGGLWRTDDGAQSWQQVPLSLPAEATVNRVQFIDLQHGYLHVQSGQYLALLGTTDGGASWTQLFPAPGPIAAIPDGLVPLKLLDDTHGVAAGSLLDRRAFLVTADGGQSWQQVGTLPEPALALRFADPQHGWAVTAHPGPGPGGTLSRSVQATEDGGRTWAAAPAGSAAADLLQDGAQAPQWFDAQHGWRVQNSQLQATANGGQSWLPLPLGYSVMQVSLLPGGQAWVVVQTCSSGTCTPLLLATPDQGVTWSRYDLGSVRPRQVVFGTPEHGLLIDTGNLRYRTEDGGRTWTQLP